MREPRTRRARRAIALVLIGVMALSIGVRLFDVQVVRADEYNEASQGRRAVPVTIPAVRGDIVDRNGAVLATTNERYDVQLSPKNTQLNGAQFVRSTGHGRETETVTSYEAFGEIGEITGQSADDIQEIVDQALKDNPKSDFAYVQRRVTLNQLNELKALQIPWLTFSSAFSRTYPNGAVAGNLIGFFGDEGNPQAGVELSQDACLVGTDGAETYERSADGVALPGSMVVTDEVVHGGQVELTIDRDLQWQAQQITNRSKDEFEAEWVLQVVMDVKTGELIAVAEDGSVDPNDVSASPVNRRDSRAFLSPYEPGSTQKTVTLATLLNEGKADIEELMTVPGTYEEPNVRFGDWYAHGPEQMTLAGVIVISSNVGTALFGKRLDPQTRYDYMRKFGLGESTNAGMPLEDSGLLHRPEDWDAQTNYTTMFGQGLSNTIVQTAGVYQTIANGGVRVPPSLVKSCTTPDGTVRELHHGDPVAVISPEAAQDSRDVLEQIISTSEYYTEQLGIPGYRVAGKTGTAQQVDGQGRYRPDFVYSFAGWVPADDPQYVIVTSVAFPKGASYQSAARHTWHDTAEAVVRHFQVPPSQGAPREIKLD